MRFGSFTLTSGKQSSYYVDVKMATSRPEILRSIAKAFQQKVRGEQVLAGVELGAVPLIVATSLEANLPFAIIRKGERAHGTGKPIEGASVQGRRVLLLEDVTTTGQSVVRAIDLLRKAGAQVDRVLTVVDRGEGAEANLRAVQAKLEALVSSQQLLAMAKEAQA